MIDFEMRFNKFLMFLMFKFVWCLKFMGRVWQYLHTLDDTKNNPIDRNKNLFWLRHIHKYRGVQK